MSSVESAFAGIAVAAFLIHFIHLALHHRPGKDKGANDA